MLIASSNKKHNEPEPLGSGYKVCIPDVCDVANPDADKSSQTSNVTGMCTLDGMAKFDMTPPRGQQERFAIAFITSCDETDADQPDVKNFHMDRMQILDQADGPKAVPVFQRLRCFTLKLNPTNTSGITHTLDIEENPNRPLRHVEHSVLCPLVTA